jgi:LemA protein
MEIGIPAVVVAGLVLLYVVVMFNALVRGRNQIEAAWRQIDVQLKRRHDLIPNLVEVTKDMMDFEQDTLSAVIEARNKAIAVQDHSRGEAIAAEGLLSAAMGRLLAVVEAYPDLKSHESAARLTEELASTENRIAFARQHYNDSVNAQNNRVETFPSNMIAGPFGFGRNEYFEVADADKEPVSVDLR